ncbi:MAG: NnrU family protein [Hyphomonadaceae bacterium]|nr:NnrU family protein [Hyphomonadaceae bacterium]
MLAFFAGLLVFFGTHFYTAFRSRDENGLAAHIGPGPYKGLYSLLTGIGFVAMVWGYAMLKPWIPLAVPPNWTRHVTMALMLPAMILIVAAYMPPAGFIKKGVKHPMLTAVKIWALAHLIANWDLASVILFGSFLIYGVVDRIALKRRGDVGFANLKPNVLGDLLSIAVGLALYLLFIYELHYMLIGVDVLES